MPTSSVPLWTLVSLLVAAAAAVVLCLGRALGSGAEAGAHGCTVLAVCASVIALQYAARALKPPPGADAALWAKLQLPRRAQHASSGIAIAGLYMTLSWELSVLCLGAAVLAFGGLVGLRRLSKEVDRQFLATFGTFLKEAERKGAPPAAFFFLLGSLLCVALLPPRICLASILAGALGDPAAALAGGLLGGPHVCGRKTIAGCSACFVVAGACGVGVLAFSPAGSGAGLAVLLWAFVLMGFATATAELLGEYFSDDNVLVLFGSGLALRGLGAACGAGGSLALSSACFEALRLFAADT